MAFTSIELLRGGVRTGYALPCYGLLAVAALLSLFRYRRVSISQSFAVCLAGTSLFFGYLLTRALWSADQFLARTDFLMMLGGLLFYLLWGTQLTSSRMRMWFIALLLALGIAHSIVGAIQFFEGQNYMPLGLFPRGDYGARASGFYGCPNHLAGFLEVTCLFGLALTCWSSWPLYGKILCGYCTLMCLGGLMITVSRGGYLSLLLGFLVFVSVSLIAVMETVHGRRWILFLGGIGAILILGFVAKTALGESYLIGDRTSALLVIDIRSSLWKAALQQFHLQPIIGTGSSTYLYYGRLFRSEDVQTDPVYVHSDYLQLLAEYGILGLLGLLPFLYLHLSRGIRGIGEAIRRGRSSGRSQDNSLALLAGALSSVAALLLHSVVDFNLHIPANVLLLAFVFAILASQERKSSTPPPTVPGWLNHSLKLVLPGLAVWMIVFTLPKFPAEFFDEKARMLLSTAAYLQSPEVDRAAEENARRGLQYDPAHAELHYFRGEAQLALAIQSADAAERTRYYTESVDSYQQALNITPQDANLLLCQAGSLDALQRFEESEAVLKRAVALDPKSAGVHWAVAGHLQQRGLIGEAEAEYKLAAHLGSNAAVAGLEQLEKSKKN